MIYKVVISVRDVAAMKKFYSQVFNIDFKEVDIGGPKLQIGKLGEIPLTLCPNAVSGVDVPQNNFQLGLVVKDIEKTHATALKSGGTAISPKFQQQGAVKAWDVRDPDGNSIELLQR